jgi:hypothetical protein
MNSLPSQKLSNEHGILFFRDLKKKLNGTPTRKMISIVRIVLNKLRGSFSLQQLNDTLNNAPSFVQWLIGYNQQHEEIHIKHLDELVELLITEDKQSGMRLFKSEIETLSIVILILRQIQILFEKVGISILPYTMERELQAAMISETFYEF